MHTVTLWDDLTATAADLTYVSLNAYYKGSGAPVTLVPEDDPSARGGVWTPKNLSYKPISLIPAGEQIVVEITVVPDDTPANVAGTQFANTAKWWFGRLIEGQFYEPLPGEWGHTPPMTIAEPELVVSKTSSETALNLGVPATFTIDVQNTGGSDAWNVKIIDQLPDGAGAGMCDFDPTTAPGGVTARIVAADGTLVSNLIQGTDYSVTYSGSPTCQLSLTTLTPAAVIGPSEHLIATYQSQLDADSTDGIMLTNVAGATNWSSSDGSYPSRTYTRTLSDGTPTIIDHEDSQDVTTALAGYYFQKTVANLASGANPASTAAPGDRLRYRLRLFNVDQTIDAITISDLLDPNSFDLTTFTMVRPPPAGAIYSFDSASGLLAISGNPAPLNVAVGGELVIEFEITLKSTLTNGTAVDNQATLSALGLTADSDDPYVNGIAPPGDPADPTRVVILAPGPLAKANLQASATIGEHFKYRITVPATPIAVPLYDVRILDDLGLSAADMRFVGANVVSGGTWALSNTGSATDLIIEDTATGIDIPANGQAVIEITVELQNLTTNQSGLSFQNSASYTYNRMNGNDATQMAGGAGSTIGMMVLEPNLTATKVAGNATPGKAAGDPIAGGDIIQYVLTLNNGGNATAYDVNVADTLPSALTFHSSFVPTATINLTPVSGFVATPADAPGGPLVWGRDNGDGSLDIPAGGSLVLTYRAQVLESTAATFSNLAWIDWTSLDDASAFERTGAGCPNTTAPDDYCYGPASVATTTSDNNSLTKAIVADSYVDAPSTAGDKIVRIGDTATYRLTLNLGEGTTRSVKVQDVLPAGMAYDSLVSITPASGSSTFTYSVVSQPAAGATNTLTWDLGNVVNAPSNDGTPVDALVIEYKAKVLPDAGIAQAPSTTLTNTATLSYLDAGGNAVVDPTRLVASDTLTLWQPVLSVNKSATPAGGDNIIEAGEAITYTVDIVNSGAAPAYDTVLVDTLPLGLRQGGVTTTSVTLVTAGTTLPVLAPAYNPATGVATWNFDNDTANAYSIPAGETLRVAYRVTADADLGAGLILTNAATATLYTSFDDEAVPAGGSVIDRQVYGPTNTARISLTTPTPGALLKENT
ncbi:MAG TPA: isopeptide-forming domain-containing fimbrial protein, partial [Gammaproteobacteria bacterium]